MKLRLAKPLLLLFLLLVSLLLLTGCASFSQDISEKGKGVPLSREDEMGAGAAVKVITTIFPLADIAGNLGGERTGVVGLLPFGASPHTYEPTVEQAKAVAGADLFIFVGGGVDDWATGLAEAENVPALEITANMEEYLLEYNPLHLGDGEGGSDEAGKSREPGEKGPVAQDGADGPGHDHSHGSFDPHVWVDPVLIKKVIAPSITERLKAIDPQGAAYYDRTLAKYQDGLDVLHLEIAASTAEFSKKGFISYHSAWNYFARRYGLEEIAAVEPFPGREPSARWLAQLVRLAEEYQINVLFAEPQLSPKAARVLAEEIKGRVLILDPLGGEGIPGRDCYTDLMRYNLEIFRAALE